MNLCLLPQSAEHGLNSLLSQPCVRTFVRYEQCRIRIIPGQKILVQVICTVICQVYSSLFLSFFAIYDHLLVSPVYVFSVEPHYFTDSGRRTVQKCHDRNISLALCVTPQMLHFSLCERLFDCPRYFYFSQSPHRIPANIALIRYPGEEAA